MANEFIARKGLIALEDSQITGSLSISQNLNVIGGLTASFDSSTSTAISGAFTSVSSSIASERLKNTTDTLTGDLTVTGTITAQDLHVQEITSSIVFSSGSNKFGENVSDTQKFTGSLQVSGSTNYLLGDVGIGTQTPSQKLHVEGRSLIQGSAGYLFDVQTTDANKPRLQVYVDDTNGVSLISGYDTTAKHMRFETGGTERMRITSGGTVKIGDGTYIAQIHFPTATYNNYIGYDGTFDGLQIATNGEIKFQAGSGYTERMRIDSSGNLSLATATSLDFNVADFAQIKFKESGAITIDSDNNQSSRNFQFKDGDGSSLMFIGDDGSVGIGTTSPLNAGTTIYTSGAAFSSTATKNSNMHGLTLVASTNEDIMTGVWFGTGGGSHWSGIAGARSNYASNWGTHLAFYTHPDATSNITDTNERMRITSEGSVGIGTTTPSAKLNTNLSVEGSILAYQEGTTYTFDGDANIAVTHNSSTMGTGTAAGLLLANNDNSNNAISPLIAFSAKSQSTSYNHTYAAIYGQKRASGADTNWNRGDLILATGESTGPRERMRITGAGDVGIGTTSPVSKFQVDGNATLREVTPSLNFRTTSTTETTMFSIIGAEYVGTPPYNSNRLVAWNSSYIALETGGAERLTVLNDGQVLINGTQQSLTNPYPLRVEAGNGGVQISLTRTGANGQIFMGGSTSATSQVFIRSGGAGGVRLDYNTTSWTSASDLRLKNVTSEITGALGKLQNIRAVNFSWKDDESNKNNLGVIAQEVEAEFPELVSESSLDSMKSVRYTEFVPVLISAIKEQQAIIEDLKARIETLEG